MSNFFAKVNQPSYYLSNYESKPAQSSAELFGRKILQVLTFGKSSLNPKLDHTIREVLQLAPGVLKSGDTEKLDDLIQILTTLSQYSDSRNGDKMVKHILNNTLGAIKAEKVDANAIKNKVKTEDFLTINKPSDPESFALGTFSHFPLTYNNLTFTCAEAAFQAQKFSDPQISQQFIGLSGAEAQNLADQYKGQIRKDWAAAAHGTMKDVLAQRSIQNPKYRELLLASQATFLVAHSKNPYWGDGMGKGKNILGQLLMEERKALGGTGVVPAVSEYFNEYRIPTKSSYTVCTYNLGEDTLDYLNLLGKIKSDDPLELNDVWSDPQLTNDAKAFVAPVRKKIQEEMADLLFHPSKGDVFCLQEVAEANKGLLKVLEGRSYDLIYKKNRQNIIPDSVIAINRAKFKDIQDHSFEKNGMDVAVASAIDRTTGKRTIFVSGHLAGYHLEKEIDEMTNPTNVGDSQVKTIIREINKIYQPGDGVIFGGDFNTSPELHQGRFDPLFDEGYGIHSSDMPTNVTTQPRTATSLTERNLDHLAVKNDFPDVKIEILPTPKEIALDPMSSSSDHLPVFLRISETARKTFLI